MKNLMCPKCKMKVKGKQTRYGIRHDCCGLHSWDGKPMVDQETHDLRKRCHAAFDRLWKHAEEMYEYTDDESLIRKFRKAARNRAYRYMARELGRPEPEVHMASMTDKELMIEFAALAGTITQELVREWALRERRDEAATAI